MAKARSILARLENSDANRPANAGKVYLFVPINGAGLGHLTRCLAIARRLEKLEPNAVIIFFTTSLGTVIVNKFGFPCFHIPPFAQVDSEFVDASRWNLLFANQLRDVIATYQPDCMIFDGTYVYGGLQQVIRTHNNLQFLWVRRAGANTRNQQALAAQTKLFNAIVTPGDIDSTTSTPTESPHSILANTVLLLEPNELLTYEEARHELALPSDKVVAYVQLGAGNINDLSQLESDVLSVLQEFEDLTILLASSPIAMQSTPGTRQIRQISSYPNARYFNGVNFAILAAGYNSVNEAVAYGLPAIFIPNMQTQSDDQASRAQHASTLTDLWHVWDGESTQELRNLVNKLYLLPMRNVSHDQRSDGASDIARLIQTL